MYSMVLLATMSTAPETPDFGRRGCRGGDAGCNGCIGSCYGGGGGCRGGGFLGGFLGGKRGGRHGCNGGCNGSWAGGCQGAWGGGYSSGCHGAWGGGSAHWSGGQGCVGGATAAERGLPYAMSGPQVAPLAADRATLVVTLPEDAKLFVDSKPTTSQGAIRELMTPPLEAGGEFTYVLVATAIRDGKEARVEKQVIVRPGEVTRLSLEVPREVSVR